MGHFQPTSTSAVCSGSWLFSAWPSFPWASLKLKQRQLPIQKLTRIFCMEATMDLDLDIMGATTATLTMATTERDLLRLSLFLLLNLIPKLKPTRIFFMATMDLDIIMGAIMATRTMAMATVTTMASKKGRDPIES